MWLIVIIASIGFLFDTYELLMTPLAGPPAIAELLKVPANHPAVSEWMGRLLWISALCGGVFGLLGGWLTDRFGRKTVMAAAIFVYSFSPFAAAYSTSLGWFVFFRSTTFIGVCVEFVAAINWLAEVFPTKEQRAKWLGITQACASLGGITVTAASFLLGKISLPHIGLPLATGAAAPSNWRYLLMTGIIPAIPIALMLPFVPESPAWKASRRAGTLRRPSFRALFSPELRRATIVTAILSACAYGIAFGALQLTPRLITPGLPNVAQQSKALAPLRKEATALNAKFDRTKPGSPERKAVVDQLKANQAQQAPHAKEVKELGDKVQGFQETGGLFGRIALAGLLILGLRRLTVLRLFQVPSLICLPLTYFVLFGKGGSVFLWTYGLCGFLTIAQFSYLGEFLPKVFPLHLRGTGGSFATNVGGRMIGTSMAVITTGVVAPLISGDPTKVLPIHVAKAAGIVALAMAIISLIAGLFLREPAEETAAPPTREPQVAGATIEG
jgi:MFS family permease